jgi:hypothetical protein
MARLRKDGSIAGSDDEFDFSGAITGTPAADTFVIDQAALLAAVAPTPTVLQITGYSAAQGDIVDFSPQIPGTQLTEASLRAAVNPAGAAVQVLTDRGDWVSVAQLDGVTAGNTVNVQDGATDVVHHVQAAEWLT